MNAATTAISGAAIPENPAPQQESFPPSIGFSGYFEQVLPVPPRICGLDMKPLSIGRYRRMRRQNVRFVAEELHEIKESELAGDLLKGALICSMRCADYDAFMCDPAAHAEIKRWAQRIGFLQPRYLDWPIVGGWINRIVGPEVTQMRAEREAVYIIEQVHAFQRYIAEGQVWPPWWDESPEGRASQSHWSHSIEGVLREKQGWSKEEVDEEPLTKALWDYCKTMENMGLGYILSEAEAKELARKLTPEEEAESMRSLKAIWEYKFPGVPMPGSETSAASPESIPDPIRQTPDPT